MPVNKNRNDPFCRIKEICFTHPHLVRQCDALFPDNLHDPCKIQFHAFVDGCCGGGDDDYDDGYYVLRFRFQVDSGTQSTET